jgi:hypothetical protein
MMTTNAQKPIELTDTNVIPVEHKSGFVTYFTLADVSYTVIAGCECPAADITLYDTPQRFDKANEHGVTHGRRVTCGFAVKPGGRTRNEEAIFGWAEARFRNDKRPQWGKVARGGIA